MSQYARPLTDEQRKARNYRKDVAENFVKGGAGIVTSESIDNLPVDGRGSLKEASSVVVSDEALQFRSEIAQVIVKVTQTHEQLLTLLKRLV